MQLNLDKPTLKVNNILLQWCSIFILVIPLYSQPLKPDTIDYSYTWINTQYLERLRADRSHAKLWDQYRIAFIGFAPNKVDMMMGDFTVGYDLRQVLKGRTLYLIPAERETEQDTLQVQWIRRNEVLSIGNDTLVKTNISSPNNILQILIYSGKYSNNNTLVYLAADGGIAGLDGYVYYAPLHNGDILRDGNDILEMKSMTGPPELFCSEFAGDTLRIYRYDCLEYESTNTQNCTTGKRGQRMYQLIRR